MFRRCLLVERLRSAANWRETLWLQCRAGWRTSSEPKLIDRSGKAATNNIRWRRAKLASAAFRKAS
ncbi:hypothetical protein J4732_08050 [Serratia marcescens]|uniref:Uncharacterized protein n=1 Tax=Serratia marcescens TaxID=615 RepID=A0A939NPR1_SERMA|nr:hypothetical protein [Serratia marcescens]